uniref:KIB1-4 beta-propeller domain-containing protein n=1 Tax=Aegilops tauschii TaxID=37682 RepID=M8CTS1_AEGTA
MSSSSKARTPLAKLQSKSDDAMNREPSYTVDTHLNLPYFYSPSRPLLAAETLASRQTNTFTLEAHGADSPPTRGQQASCTAASAPATGWCSQSSLMPRPTAASSTWPPRPPSASTSRRSPATATSATSTALVLYHKPTTTIRLLDPLTSALTEFPAISSIVPAVPLDHHTVLLKNPLGTIPRAINGAAFDDSTSPPTLLLCLRGGLATIIFAIPGDAHWTMVIPGRSTHPRNYEHQQLLFFTLLSLGGRCYISSPEGSVYLMELEPLPRLVDVVDERRFAEPDNIWREHIMSFLVSGTGGRMLMVRYWSGMERFGGVEAYNPEELFMVRGITSCIEVLQVDIAGGRLLPVRSLGRHAVFIGLTHFKMATGMKPTGFCLPKPIPTRKSQTRPRPHQRARG